MKISTLIFAAVASVIPLMASAQAYDFEQGGLYYKIAGEEVRIVKPEPDFTYSGEVTVPIKVTHDGTTYSVNLSSVPFSASDITALTIGEGWGGIEKFNRAHLIESALTKITFMAPGENENTEPLYQLANLNLSCDNTDVAHGTLDFDGEKHILKIHDFNVFDAEGNELTPLLHNQETHAISQPEVSAIDGRKVYTFILPKELSPVYGVLEMLAYDLCTLYVKVDQSYAGIRIRLGKYDNGIYYTDGILRYSLYNNELVVLPPEGDNVYSGDVTIPAALDIDGKTVAVTKVASLAFFRSGIKSATLSESIVEIGYHAFAECPFLESVDISACENINDNNNNNWVFSDNIKLTEVKMPVSVAKSNFYWSYYFDNCPELPSINVPEGAWLNNTVTGCNKIINLEILSNTDDEAVFTVSPKIFRNDGITPIDLRPQGDKVTATDGTDGKTLYTVKKEDLYEVIYDDHKRYSGLVNFEAVNADGYLNPDKVSVPFSITIPEHGDSGVALPAVDNSTAPVEYYNLQGVRVAAPAHGLYIRRQGSQTTKVIL